MGILQSFPWAPNARKTSGPYTGGPPKGLFHATISPSIALPDYAGQTIAPQATLLWDPHSQRVSGYQHYFWDNFGKALVHNGPVETNRDSVLQVELAGYLGASTPKGEFDILEAPATYWEQVADLVGPAFVSWGIPNVIPRDWSPNGRMGLSEWDNYSGLCAHVHVPENDHVDLPIPQHALDIIQRKIWISAPQVIIKPNPTPQPVHISAPPFPMAPTQYYGVLDMHNNNCHSGTFSSVDRAGIRTWQIQMAKRGWNIAVTGIFDTQSANVCGAFQTEKHLRPDKHVGQITWAAAWNLPTH